MKRIFVGSIAVGLVVMLAGCGGPQVPLDTKVKGLYLGMPIDDAHTVCTQLLEGNDWGITVSEIGEGDSSLLEIGVPDAKNFGFNVLGARTGSGGVTADANGKGNGFSFSGAAVNHIWQGESMDEAAYCHRQRAPCPRACTSVPTMEQCGVSAEEDE